MAASEGGHDGQNVSKIHISATPRLRVSHRDYQFAQMMTEKDYLTGRNEPMVLPVCA